MIGVINCGKQKQQKQCRAGDMYTSSFFKMNLEHAKSQCKKVVILSAKYGVLELDDIIQPYDLALATFDKTKIKKWAIRTNRQLRYRIGKDQTFYCLASNKYKTALNGLDVIDPLIGLDLYKRTKWLKENT